MRGGGAIVGLPLLGTQRHSFAAWTKPGFPCYKNQAVGVLVWFPDVGFLELSALCFVLEVELCSYSHRVAEPWSFLPSIERTELSLFFSDTAGPFLI